MQRSRPPRVADQTSVKLEQHRTKPRQARRVSLVSPYLRRDGIERDSGIMGEARNARHRILLHPLAREMQAPPPACLLGLSAPNVGRGRWGDVGSG